MLNIMNIVLMLLVCFLPLLIFYVCFVIVLRRPYVFAGIESVFLGIAAVIPAVFLQHTASYIAPFLQGMPALLFGAFITASLIEETSKTAVLCVLPVRSGAKIFFACCLTAGLAFGSFETVVYLLSGSEKIVTRLFTAVLFHGFTAGLDGFWVWQLKNKSMIFSAAGTRLHIHSGCLLFSIFLHGLYNLFAEMGGFFQFFSLVCIIAAGGRLLVYFRQAQAGL